MQFPLNTDILVENLKSVYLQCYIWLNTFTTTLAILNTEFFGKSEGFLI